MEWRVYASRKDYEDSDGGARATHSSIESGSRWDLAPGGVWAVREGETMPVYVRKRPGKGKPFWYRVEGETAPAERAQAKTKAKAPKNIWNRSSTSKPITYGYPP